MSGSALEGGAVFEREGQQAVRIGRDVVQQAAPELENDRAVIIQAKSYDRPVVPFTGMTVEATERFVFFSCVAMGLVQMMALTPSIAEQAKKARYLRTQTPGKVSEATILSYLAKNFYHLLLFRPDSGLSRIIRQAQREGDGDEAGNEVA